MTRQSVEPVPGAAPISKGTAAAAGRSVSSTGEGLAHAEVEPVRCYSTFEEAAADLVEIVDRHGEALIAVFAAAGWKTRHCAGRGGLETGAAVSDRA